MDLDASGWLVELIQHLALQDGILEAHHQRRQVKHFAIADVNRRQVGGLQDGVFSIQADLVPAGQHRDEELVIAIGVHAVGDLLVVGIHPQRVGGRVAGARLGIGAVDGAAEPGGGRNHFQHDVSFFGQAVIGVEFDPGGRVNEEPVRRPILRLHADLPQPAGQAHDKAAACVHAGVVVARGILAGGPDGGIVDPQAAVAVNHIPVNGLGGRRQD